MDEIKKQKAEALIAKANEIADTFNKSLSELQKENPCITACNLKIVYDRVDIVLFIDFDGLK